MSTPLLRTLGALRRLRRVETDEARRALADALAGEARIAERNAALAGELTAARRMAGDYDREAFAAWLARMGTERARLAGQLRAAEARTAAVRADLAHCGVAEKAAEEALAQAVAARAAVAAKVEQVMMEDAARAMARRVPG